MDKIKERVWKIGTIVGILLAVFLAVLSIKELNSISIAGDALPPTHTIAVDGLGEVYALPDVATISFSVTENAKVVSDAQTAATTKINAVLKDLEVAGIAKKDIQTTSYSINPHYEYQATICRADGVCPPSRNIVTGYDVSQGIQFKVRDLTKLGNILTLMGSRDVQDLNGPQFAVDQPEGVKAEARAKAIAQARAKADVLANALGVRLGRVINFSESNYNDYRVYGMGAEVSMAKASPTVAPELPTGQSKITSNVTITYEIK